jgi:hypothetical protein
MLTPQNPARRINSHSGPKFYDGARGLLGRAARVLSATLRRPSHPKSAERVLKVLRANLRTTCQIISQQDLAGIGLKFVLFLLSPRLQFSVVGKGTGATAVH